MPNQRTKRRVLFLFYYITRHVVLPLGGMRSFLFGPLAASGQSQTVERRFHWSSRLAGRACHRTYPPSALPSPSVVTTRLAPEYESDSVQAHACSCARGAGELVCLLHWAHRAGTPQFLLRTHNPAPEAPWPCSWLSPSRGHVASMQRGSFTGKSLAENKRVPRVSPFLSYGLGRFTSECDPGKRFPSSWLTFLRFWRALVPT